MNAYETVIGLEVHVQLSTRSKAFCADDTTFGAPPNTQTSAVSLAHPGTLPRLNRRAVEYAVRLGLALGCAINRNSRFDRKNYFYADLPKGYQITQDESPICIGGRWTGDGGRGTGEGERETVDGGRRTVDGGRETVDGGRETGDGGRDTVDSGRETGDGGQTHAPKTASSPTPSTVNRPPSPVNRQPSTVSRQPPAVRIHHIHLEEDAGKSLHDQHPEYSLIDLNRAGVPLLEIVTEPDLRSADEVAAFMNGIRRLVRWLGISDGNMEEGSLRCDLNISIRPQGETRLGTRCEVKNVNSMRFARRAIAFEVARQREILDAGGVITQETRGFDAATGTTYSLRDKEDAHDYRYFPEPDLPPVTLTEAFVDTIRKAMPPLPGELEQLFTNGYGLSEQDAAALTQERDTALYFRALVQQPGARAKLLANLVIQKLIPWATENELPVSACPVRPKQWMTFTDLIDSGQISATAAYQRLFPALLDQPDAAPAQLAATLQLFQNSDETYLLEMAEAVLSRFPDKVQEYRKGKKGLIGFFMGELMKASRGKADPKTATQILQDKLNQG